jgi:DNA-binding MarR family transcriptional regulator
MGESLTDLEIEAWQALLSSHYQVTRHLDAELRRQQGLGLREVDVLLRLAHAPERRLRMTLLAQRVLFSPSGLTRAVDRLVEAGLVERRRDPADARVVLARITDKGQDRVESAAQTHIRGIRRHFTARLSERQLREVASALQLVAGPHKPH